MLTEAVRLADEFEYIGTVGKPIEKHSSMANVPNLEKKMLIEQLLSLGHRALQNDGTCKTIGTRLHFSLCPATMVRS